VTLPGWLDELYVAEEMQAADAHAIEEVGVPSLELMERAAEGLARAVGEVAETGPVRVVCGPGNNGGDGLAAARLLRQEGHEVEVIAVAPLEKVGGDARANLERLPGDPPRECADGLSADALAGSGAVLDAMLGTGFAGEPRDSVARSIAAINEQSAPVVACDVPSGVDGSSGEVAAEAVRAAVTATFHAPKVGLYVAPGAFYAGAVRVVEIGIPRGAPAPATAGLISARALDLVPSRTRGGSKFDSGAVVVAGGAQGLTGAPCMAALAAQRTGAGYVQVAVPASTESVFELRLLEGMTVGLPEREGAHAPEGVEEVLSLCGRAGALVLGPGISRAEPALDFAREIARGAPTALLIDADGLNAHAGRLEDLRERPAPTVLTPHAGELGRLLERDSSEVSAHRLDCVREAAERSGAVVLLKGDDTLVAAPGGPVAVSPGATAALATAGTGDVLSGVIAAFLAKGLDAFAAAAAGAFGHARAGLEAARRHGADHTIASDVIDALPAGLRRSGD
jgi:NAD(P)H-hydrate epimerase